jgi:hypothetical protein
MHAQSSVIETAATDRERRCRREIIRTAIHWGEQAKGQRVARLTHKNVVGSF